MTARGLSERRSLDIVQMSASSLRYEPRTDRNEELRTEIIRLAQRYKRYGAGMIYLKLRQDGWVVNHKRVDLELPGFCGHAVARAPPASRSGLRNPRPGQCLWLRNTEQVVHSAPGGRTGDAGIGWPFLRS